MNKMKKQYRFSSGESIAADVDDLRALQQQLTEYLNNYLELYENLDDESYIARGNGFCEAKYSEDFVEGQIAKYRQRLSEVEGWLAAEKD